MNIISISDFNLLQELSSRSYSDNSMSTNSTEKEREFLRRFKAKLKFIALDYENEFNEEYGPFDSRASSGNPIKFNTTKINRIWAGIFKGASNKQYSAQISFVVNEEKKNLDVGFYFGRASSRGSSADEEKLFEIANSISSSILEDSKLREQFESLIDYGFQPYVGSKKVDTTAWLQQIKINPANSQIIYRLNFNEDGNIEPSTLKMYVSMLMFLMGLVPSEKTSKSKKVNKPFTPEQRAKQAERRTLIGAKGEEFVYNQEKKRLLNIGIDTNEKLHHVALESDHYGYDIKSWDEKLDEIYIEVKTTTRNKNDMGSNIFHMSSNEFRFYENNKSNYRLVRVYNIEGDNPESVIIDLNSANFSEESYLVEIAAHTKTIIRK